jgi:hypothetical protein
VYRAGDIISVSLDDLPHAAGWTISAIALVLASDSRELLLLVADPYGGGATVHAAGQISVLDGRPPAINQPVTDGIRPGRITLGQVAQSEPDCPGLPAAVQRAQAALEPYRRMHGTGPLGPEHLPVLDLAMAVLAERRAEENAAGDVRDQIVRRLRAGGVQSKAIARPGMSTSRISQLYPPAGQTA